MCGARTGLTTLLLVAACSAPNPAFRGDELVPPDAAAPDATVPDASLPPDALPPLEGPPGLDVDMPDAGALDSAEDSNPADAGPSDTDPERRDAAPDGAPDAGFSIAVSASSFAIGEPIVVTFSGGSGNPRDWLGVYLAGETPNNQNQLISQVWSYLAAPTTPGSAYDPHTVPAAGLTSGTLVLKGGSENPVTTWPLAAGDYQVHLFFNDDHESRASAEFTVHR